MTSLNEKAKVLVIDDERLIRLMLSAKLKQIGCTAVCVESIPEAVALLNNGGHKKFKAIIADIMMGDMDGFVFRDIVRGMDEAMPIFFMTALDPEEGSGFLKRIMEDGHSFYLPKSLRPDLLLKRVQSIIASRRAEDFIKAKDKEALEALTLGGHLQRKLMPPHIGVTDNDFYSYWWDPENIVSGDLLEIMPLPDDARMYILGDIEGHGTSAALSMMAVQSFLKLLPTIENLDNATPASVANLIQRFFVDNLGSLSYMATLICIHRPKEGVVDWISCGAPDLFVIDPADPEPKEVNPEKRGGMPIGMMQDTVYTDENVVRTAISDRALCVAFSDGVLDVYRDEDGHEPAPDSFLPELLREMLPEAERQDTIIICPYKFRLACSVFGYNYFADDMTALIFGTHFQKPGTLIKTVPMDPETIDEMAQQLEKWCTGQGWDPETITKVEVVFGEKMMNLYDHGYDAHDRAGEEACFRLKKVRNLVELTVWDWGTPEPSITVAAGNSELELELKNRDFSSRGRGRLMLRKICEGIERNRFDTLNETIYRIAMNGGAQREGAK